MPKRIDLPEDKYRSSGIDITYYTTKRELVIGGWYDGFVGIPSTSIGLGAFLRRLGITEKDVRRALADSSTTEKTS